MSQLPPMPPENAVQDIAYMTPPPNSTAKTLLKLAVIFNFVMAGLDGVYGLFLLGMTLFMPWVLSQSAAGGGGAGTAPPPTWVLVALYGGMGIMSIAVGVLKLVGGLKLMRLRPGAWGWGLAAGIAGCPQVWCSLFCVMPLAVAIYTIVVLCRQDVRWYLHTMGGQEQSVMSP